MSAASSRIVAWLRGSRARRLTVLVGVAALGLLVWIVVGQVTGRVPVGWQEHRVGESGMVAVPDDWEATTFDPPDGEGACQREDAPGVLVIESGLWDACPEQSEPPRIVVGWSALNIAPDDLADAERVEVAGEPALRLEQPQLIEPDERRFDGQALLVPSLDLHLLVHDEVAAATAERIAGTLQRRDGPDRELARVLEHSGPDGSTQLWALDADARAYPLAEGLPEFELSRRWPQSQPQQIAHAWVADEQLRLTAGGPSAGSDHVTIREADVRAMDFSADGRDLFWIEQGDAGPVVGHAHWDIEQATELRDHLTPEVATAPADGMPSDVEIGVLDHRDTDPPQLDVVEATDEQHRQWTLELVENGDDWALPEDPRFVELDP